MLVALLLVVAGLVLRESRGETAPGPVERYSGKPSACGPDAGMPARELSRVRARELVLCLHNEQRARHGLPALEYEARLELAAQRHAEDMVRRRFFAHDTPDGLRPEDRALMAGYPTKHYSSGENLAWGTGSESSPVEIVDGWMRSPGHRENVLRRAFTQMGVGLVLGVPEDPKAPLPGATYATSFGGPPLPGPPRP
jgi:Cysteine-rich secretory protein family